MVNYATSKKALVHLQTICRNGKDAFKPSLQKKLIKEITTSESGMAAFESKVSGSTGPWIILWSISSVFYFPKVNQNALGDTVKQVVSSWSHSIVYLGDEVDRRILKLQ